MSILRYSLPLLVVSLLTNILLHPLTSDTNTILSNPNANILLLTAHPDDECMFFAPTVLSLTKHHHIENAVDGQGNANSKPLNVFSLALSVGDAEGLGERRREELGRSLDVLGVKEGRRWVVDHPELLDDMKVQWKASTIAKVIEPYIREHHIDTILTFDRHGISSHPNHFSLPAGVLHYIENTPSESRPRLFSLITVPLLPKYIGPIASLLAKFDVKTAALFDDTTRANVYRVPVFVSGVEDWWTAVQAMLEHQSQMVWFRWLYVAFSRYMWVNEWIEVLPGRLQTSA